MKVIILVIVLLGFNNSIALDAADYPTSNYALFNTSLQGLPVVLVVNSSLVDFKLKQNFPWHLSIIIEIQELAEKGMPTISESLLISELAEELEAEVIKTKNAIFLARQTWNGMKQLLFRVNNPEEMDVSLQALLNTHKIREWEYRMERDNEWGFTKVYLDLLKGAKGNVHENQ